MLPKVRTHRGHRVRRPPALTARAGLRARGSGAIGIDVQIEDATGLVHCEAIAARTAGGGPALRPRRLQRSGRDPDDHDRRIARGLPRRPPQPRLLADPHRGPRGGRPGDRRPVRRPRRRRGPAHQGAPRAGARLRRQVVDPPRADRRRSTRSSRRPTPRSPARTRSWPPTGRPRRAPHASRARWSTRRAARWPRGSSGPVALRDAFRPAARRMADDTRSPKHQPVGHDVRIRVVLKPIPR